MNQQDLDFNLNTDDNLIDEEDEFNEEEETESPSMHSASLHRSSIVPDDHVTDHEEPGIP